MNVGVQKNALGLGEVVEYVVLCENSPDSLAITIIENNVKSESDDQIQLEIAERDMTRSASLGPLKMLQNGRYQNPDKFSKI